MKKVLVTGASGFLGRALVERLRREGVTVRALVRSGAPREIPADEIFHGDLADPAGLDGAFADGIDCVFHGGARVSTAGRWEEFEAVNVRGTAEVLRLAAGFGVERVVHVSSLAVYDVPADGAVISEESPLESGAEHRGHYARSKWEADRVACAAIERGARVVVLRPGVFYGPGRKPPLGRRVIAFGPFRVLLADRGYRLPLTYVDNLVDALLLAGEREEAVGRVYTIVDAHVPQGEYARMYREASGQRWIPVYPPLGIVRLLASVVERGAGLAGRRPPLTRHQVERTLRSATFEVARAERELGWSPRVGVREALQRTFARVPVGQGQESVPTVTLRA